MRKAVIAGLAVLAIAALALAASDPWKSKPYQQWDENDIKKVLQNSPWAKMVNVDANWAGGEASPGPTALPQGSSSGGGSGGGGGRPGGTGGGGGGSASAGGGQPNMGPTANAAGGPVQAPFAVRWLSARTIREALVRSAELNGKMQQAEADKQLAQTPDVYEVIVQGPQMTPFESMEEAQVQQNASLTTKKAKQKIQASKVEFQHGPDGKSITAIIVAFPKKTANGEATIGPDEKGAEFALVAGKTTIKTNFDFSKMYDAQGRDL